jgi:ribose 5-phosphate isomerase A
MNVIEQQKRAAAQAAVAQIMPGMVVGLGTGSTAAFAVAALGVLVAQGLSVRAVATSRRTETQARGLGIPLLDLADVAQVDLCIDGVDEIDPALRAIKGAGGAMLREKVVASAAARMLAIADGSKGVAALGAQPVPVEVLPLARAFVARQVGLLGCDPVLRRDGAGAPVLTDQGNIILDCHGVPVGDLADLARAFDGVPGLLGHGLFLTQVDALYLGTADGVVVTQRAMNSHVKRDPLAG